MPNIFAYVVPSLTDAGVFSVLKILTKSSWTVNNINSENTEAVHWDDNITAFKDTKI